MRGKTGRDEVCLGSARSSCVEGLEFFSYHNQTGLIDPIEGTLGLAQNKQMLYSSTEIDIAELFVNELYKKSNIPEATFSFGMMGFNDFDQSFVDFGLPDEFRVNEGEISAVTTVTLGFNDDFYWSTYL